MKINWFTVIAQVINFLILVWLLKRFLYKPVLNAIDEREKKIVSRLEDAKSKKAEAEKEQDEFTHKNEVFEQEKKGLMDKATADIQIQKEKLLGDAGKEVDALRSNQKKALDDMQEEMKNELIQKTQEEVFDISRKVLKDLASVSLEEQAVKLFISRLQDQKAEGKQLFLNAFKSGSGPVLLQSAFDLQKKQQTDIKKVVDEILGKETEFQCKTSPEIISGIELTTNGYKISWSIASYLDLLQNNISETIKEDTQSTPPTEKAPDKKMEAKEKQAPEKDEQQEKK